MNAKQIKFRDETLPAYSIDHLIDALVRLTETRANAQASGDAYAHADRTTMINLVRDEITRRTV